MYKKMIFLACVLMTLSASAIFIPLQKDGSVRFGGSYNSTTSAKPAKSSESTAKAEALKVIDKTWHIDDDEDMPSRMPAGQDLPGVSYTPPPQEPEYVEVPATPEVTYTPPPTGYRGPACEGPVPAQSGGLSRFYCIKRGFVNAGSQYANISNKYIAALATAAKVHWDHSGVTDGQKCRNAMRSTILSAVAFGYCSRESGYEFPPSGEKGITKGWLSSSKLSVSRNDYAAMFGVGRGSVGGAMDLGSYNGYIGNKTPRKMRNDWRWMTRRSVIGSCPKEIVPSRERVRVCKIIARTCGVDSSGCGRGNFDNDPPRDGGNDGASNGNNNGNNHGGNDGGNQGNNGGNNGGNDGGNQGNNGGNDDGGREQSRDTSNGENNSGADPGSNQGDGPPGSK